MSTAPPVCPDLVRSVSACGDPAFIVDEKRAIVHWNAAAQEAFGLAIGDVRGKLCYEVIGGLDARGKQLCRSACQKWALAARGARIPSFELRVLPSHSVWTSVTVLPVYDPTGFDPNGRLIGLVHIVRNLDRVKRLERFVQDLARTAEGALTSRLTNGHVREDHLSALTNRELEVLRLIAHGATTAAIAGKLGISRHTARNHVAAVLAKLGLHSRVEAAAYAHEHELT